MAQRNNREVIFIPSKKRKTSDIHCEATSRLCDGVNESTNTLETIQFPGYNIEYNEEAVFEHRIPLLNQSMEPCETLIPLPSFNIDYNEETVNEHEIPLVNQSINCCETLQFPDSNFTYNKESMIEYDMSFVHQYCHMLLKESQLWYLEEANVYIMPDYKVNEG